jgi:hypothetical protein
MPGGLALVAPPPRGGKLTSETLSADDGGLTPLVNLAMFDDVLRGRIGLDIENRSFGMAAIGGRAAAA